MQPTKNRRRFYTITAVIFAVIIASAVGIVLYTDYSYMNVEIVGNANASFVLSYDSSSVTVNASENATIAVLPHSNVTIKAVIDQPFVVDGWVVTGAAFHPEGNDTINFLTGSGASTIEVSASISSPSSPT